MTFVFGRKRLVISLLSERSNQTLERYPMAYQASDRELERLNRLTTSTVAQADHDVQRVLHGAGWVR